MDGNKFYRLLILLFSFGLLVHLKHVSGSASGFRNGRLRCIEGERQALLKFKQGLVDDSGLLSSWGNGEDNKECCKWWGVKCSNRTGHVIFLDLHGDFSSLLTGITLKGDVGLSLLFGLPQLRYVDLSFNDFTGIQMGEPIGSLHTLKYLNLSSSGFSGVVPHQLGNLTGLQSLDLSRNYLSTDGLVWLSQLRFLRQLDLSWISLNVINWVQVISDLPFLEELHLGSCELGHAIPSSLLLPNSSSNSLSILDLSDNSLTSSSTYYWLFNISKNLVSINLFSNDLEGPIPDLFGEMISLEDVNMGSNYLIGGIPRSFRNLSYLHSLILSNNHLTEPLMKNFVLPPSLEVLDLSSNQIRGNLVIRRSIDSFRQPSNLPVLSSLSELYLNNNRFTGRIPKSIGQFSKLKILRLSSNLLEGEVSEVHFSRLSNLKELWLSFNSLTIDIVSEWIPPFQLDVIKLANCSMGPYFPPWLKTQNNFSVLDISSNGILDAVPNWFWDLSPKLRYLNLSHNQISGRSLQLSRRFDNNAVINLSHNNFSGPIISVPNTLFLLDLHKNMFEGSIYFICGITSYRFRSLDLSDNLFTGDLPDCWMNMKGLVALNLANNSFSGQIPQSLSFLHELRTLHLRHNSFVGQFPSAIRNCRLLEVIDFGGNKLSGDIPSWIGTDLASLVILSLRLNNFRGNIPQDMCHLSQIQVLDLSTNSITGKIPQCFNNFTYLVGKNTSDSLTFGFGAYGVDFHGSYGGLYMDDVLVQWKRQELQYRETLGLLKTIDFSNNKLVGQIPQEMASLKGLISLNLSINCLTGNIISQIDQMEMLESLDLSRNQLSDKIPTGLARLNYLAVLDLSYNNLSGKIPSSTQLQSFDPSAYMGNNSLCGLPLNECPGDDFNTRHGKDGNIEGKDEFMSKEVYMVMGLGFLVGLGGVVAILLKGSWRNAYFRFLMYACDWFYVKLMVYWLRLKRMLING